MPESFETALMALCESKVQIFDDDAPEENGQAIIVLNFGNGVSLRAHYWRFINDSKTFSSFDHKQMYGLSSPFNAKEELRYFLGGLIISSAKIDRQTADLQFVFSNGEILQIFSFDAYEDWDMSFPDGSREFSNHVERSG
jgi:hypothetical protein